LLHLSYRYPKKDLKYPLQRPASHSQVIHYFMLTQYVESFSLQKVFSGEPVKAEKVDDVECGIFSTGTVPSKRPSSNHISQQLLSSLG
jgi:hypothetical protein